MTPVALGRSDEATEDKGVVQFVGIPGFGPGLRPNNGDRLRIQAPEFSRLLRVDPAAIAYGVGSPLLQGGVVQEGVGACRQQGLGQR